MSFEKMKQMKCYSIQTLLLASAFILSIGRGQDMVVEFIDSKVEVNEGDHFNVRIVKQGAVEEPVLIVVSVSSEL